MGGSTPIGALAGFDFTDPLRFDVVGDGPMMPVLEDKTKINVIVGNDSYPVITGGPSIPIFGE